MKTTIKVGAILRNEINQFSKVISVEENGRYGLGGFTNLVSAKKQTVATKFVNVYGLEAMKVTIVKGTAADDLPESEDGSSDNTKPSKSSLTKMSAPEVHALAESLAIDATGTKPEVLERLFAHYGL